MEIFLLIAIVSWVFRAIDRASKRAKGAQQAAPAKAAPQRPAPKTTAAAEEGLGGLLKMFKDILVDEEPKKAPKIAPPTPAAQPEPVTSMPAPRWTGEHMSAFETQETPHEVLTAFDSVSEPVTTSPQPVMAGQRGRLSLPNLKDGQTLLEAVILSEVLKRPARGLPYRRTR